MTKLVTKWMRNFARIATEVDKYQLHVGIDEVLDQWTSNLWNRLEKASTSGTIESLWITRVFRYANHYTTVVAYSIKHSTMHLTEASILEISR
jgi:hypothetical protein